MVDLSLLAHAAEDAITRKRKWNVRPLVETERADPYPVEFFPPLIREAVEEVQACTQAPMALVAASALSAVSAAVQARFSVQRDNGLTGPAGLYLLTVAESGERKSTVDKKFSGPIRDWEAAQARNLKEKRAKYKAELEDWEAQGSNLRDNVDSGALREQLGTMLDPRVQHELAKPEEPRLIRIMRGDDTPEALAKALEVHPVAVIISAEAGIIFGSHGMSDNSAMRNLSQANEMWDGGVIHRDRIGNGETHVEGMRVTMGLQVQPQALEVFTRKTGGLAKGIGYFARFLFSQPESTQGTRLYVPQPADQPALRAFCNRMTTLLDMEAQFDEDGRLQTALIGFDPAAQRAWESFVDEVEVQMGGDERYAGIKEVASKAADNAARLACCMHVFGGDPSRAIDQITVTRACTLMRWYLSEAVRFATVNEAGEEVSNAELLEQWLVREVKKRGRASESPLVSVHDARQTGPNKIRKRPLIDAAIELLSDRGRLCISKRMGAKGLDLILAPDVLAEYS